MRNIKKHEEAVDEIRKVLLREHGVKDYEVLSRIANLKREQQRSPESPALVRTAAAGKLPAAGRSTGVDSQARNNRTSSAGYPDDDGSL